ncbi:MAG TPA: hypothetical protein VGI81_01935 [Tepidisphaeraceae bacterium]
MTRPAAPDSTAAAKARKLVNEVYADALRDARTPGQKLELAKRVIQDAAETKDDPAGRYVMLGLARELATDACDAPTALAAVSATGDFNIDVAKAKLDALVALAKCSNPDFDPRRLLMPINACIDEAVNADNYKVASQLAELGTSIAERTQDRQSIKSTQARVQEVKEIAARFAQNARAAETLRTAPTEPKANLLEGRFLCFVKGNWPAGLLMLSRGSDADLKSLAEAELARPTDPAKQVALGDGWWEQAGHETGMEKTRLLAHAAAWYSAALPNETGIGKRKIEKRLAELPAGVVPPAAVAPVPGDAVAGADAPPAARGPVVSKFLYLVADDFVVEIYVDGKRVEDENRHLQAERYGATEERVDLELHSGDWIVFNVVNDRLRWDGAKYFAAAGMMDEGKPVFWTDASGGKWSFCDAPGQPDEFIAKPTYLASHHVETIEDHKWDAGDGMMQDGVKDWRGEAIWAPGRTRNIWIKYVIGNASAAPGPKTGEQPSEATPSHPASRPTRIFDVP